MNSWEIAYSTIALLTFLPVLVRMVRGVKLHPTSATGGVSALLGRG